ncbi:uncharacterized protein LOC121861120 [Homarus americanus]|uniref:uncharacterized protein LOC121861120 n=1 Tax=Homarus americanus TaxID=6706 RepID=UPI001C45FA4E|nr:uncharacterized protein LOC121861120 [Homarus americanus]
MQPRSRHNTADTATRVRTTQQIQLQVEPCLADTAAGPGHQHSQIQPQVQTQLIDAAAAHGSGAGFPTTRGSTRRTVRGGTPQHTRLTAVLLFGSRQFSTAHGSRQYSRNTRFTAVFRTLLAESTTRFKALLPQHTVHGGTLTQFRAGFAHTTHGSTPTTHGSRQHSPSTVHGSTPHTAHGSAPQLTAHRSTPTHTVHGSIPRTQLTAGAPQHTVPGHFPQHTVHGRIPQHTTHGSAPRTRFTAVPDTRFRQYSTARVRGIPQHDAAVLHNTRFTAVLPSTRFKAVLPAHGPAGFTARRTAVLPSYTVRQYSTAHGSRAPTAHDPLDRQTLGDMPSIDDLFYGVEQSLESFIV